MLAWRICRAAFSDLSGEGARRFGGRWNSPGAPLIYAAESAALAVLEVRVHLDLPPDLLPDDYELVGIETGDVPAAEIGVLPEDCQAAGDDWLALGRTAALRVPSVIVPESSNLLLNPRHPDAFEFRIASRRSFRFDSRLWRPFGGVPLV